MKSIFKNKRGIITVGALFLVISGVSGTAFYLKQNKKPDLATVSISKTEGVKDVAGANTIKYPIFIDTKDDVINAAEAYITFDPSIIEVEEVSKSGSFIKIWIDNQPKFDNSKGEISFAGGLPRPGFKGRGQIGTVTLKFIKNKTVQLTFTSKTRILKNDGLGTFVPLNLEPVTIEPN